MKIYRSKIYDGDIEDISIKLSIDLNEFSNPENNSGYIEIKSVNTSNENSCFWDNLDFFIYNNNKTIKEECKQELIDKNLYAKGIFKIIKNLINVAISDDMLTKINKND